MGKTGRPRASSTKTLEEAASELFFERGYDNTSIDDIAWRAGVSRATFFNYFPSKADVLCVDIDRALERLRLALDSGVSLTAALRQVSDATTPADIPLIVRQSEVMGLPEDIDGVLPMRLLRLKTLVARRIADPIAQWAVVGAIVEGARQWAQHPEHGSLDSQLQKALAALNSIVRDDVQAALA